MRDMKFCPSCAAPLRPRQMEGRERLGCSSETCDYVYYDNPTPVVAALIEHGGTVLLVRGKGWPEKWYGLVTGQLPTLASKQVGQLVDSLIAVNLLAPLGRAPPNFRRQRFVHEQPGESYFFSAWRACD